MMMMMEDDVDDQQDEEPQFLSAADAVEVAVDDENVPMEDDDDEDEPTETDQQQQQQAVAASPDLSTHQYRSHTGPVYAVVAAHWSDDAAAASSSSSTGSSSSSSAFVVVSGGGDDRAYLHRSSSNNNNNNNANKEGPRSSSSSSVQLPHPHTDSVSAVALNWKCSQFQEASTPRMIAVAGYDGAIVLYDGASGTKLKQLEGPTDVEWLSFHPTGTVLLAGSAADGTVWMYHAVLDQCMQVFVGHESAVTAGCFTPNGKLAVTASADGTLRVWAPKTGQAKHVVRFQPQQQHGNNNRQCCTTRSDLSASGRRSGRQTGPGGGGRRASAHCARGHGSGGGQSAAFGSARSILTE